MAKVWEGHPFTLASIPSTSEGEGGDGAKLVVKAAGDWTNRLFEVAKKGIPKGGDSCGEAVGRQGRGYPVAVLIEGPYGKFFAFSSPRRLLLAFSDSKRCWLVIRWL